MVVCSPIMSAGVTTFLSQYGYFVIFSFINDDEIIIS